MEEIFLTTADGPSFNDAATQDPDIGSLSCDYGVICPNATATGDLIIDIDRLSSGTYQNIKIVNTGSTWEENILTACSATKTGYEKITLSLPQSKVSLSLRIQLKSMGVDLRTHIFSEVNNID